MLANAALWFRRIGRFLAAATAGAWLLASYILATYPGSAPEIDEFARKGFLIWYLPLILLQEKTAKPPYIDVSPARSGAGVLLATGLAAAMFWPHDYRELSDLMLLGAIIVAAGAGAFFLARFAKRHAGEIGQARFGPDGRELGPWIPPATRK